MFFPRFAPAAADEEESASQLENGNPTREPRPTRKSGFGATRPSHTTLEMKGRRGGGLKSPQKGVSVSIIHILVHGLIALVPATDPGGVADHMTALLVDARNQPPEFTKCFAPHLPAITVQMEEPSECQKAKCTFDGDSDCTCPLIRKEVSLQAQISPQPANRRPLNVRLKSALPFSHNEARDFSYVANLSRMGYELDTRYLDAVPPDGLIARMTFPFEAVDACSLGTRRDEESDNVHPLSFRPITSLETAGEPHQALAQMVSATLTTNPGPVILTITDFGGGNPKNLPLKPINGVYLIQLTNIRTDERGEHDLPPDDPCDDGVERDFAFFYKLVKNPLDWRDRPIPHIKFTRWKSVKNLEISECKQNMGHKLPNSHPICALATFAPSE